MKRQAHWCPLTKALALSVCVAYGIPLKDGSEQTDEEAEGPFSDDEMVTHKGLRRSQSMKSVKTIKGRKEVSVHWECFSSGRVRGIPSYLVIPAGT